MDDDLTPGMQFEASKTETASLLKQVYSILLTEPLKSLELAHKALDASRSNPENKFLFLSLRAIGDVYYALKNYNKSLEYRLTALQSFENSGQDLDNVSILIGIGNIYRRWNKFDKALEYYNRILQVKNANKVQTAYAYNSIGIVYDNSGKFEKALEFYEKALKLRKELGDNNGSASILDNIGIVYDKKGDYETALEYYQQSLEINESDDNKKGIAASLINIGVTFYNLKKYDTALEYILKSLKISEELDDNEGILYALFNIGNIYKFSKKYDKALEILNNALTAGKKDSPAIMRDIYKLMSDIYFALKDYKSAYKYQRYFYDMKERVFAEENNIKVEELLSRFEIEKKEREIELLKKEKNFQQMKYNYIQETKQILVEKNKTIEDRNNELKELNATKDKFFSIIAHDLRNPFNALISLSEMLLRDYKEMPDDEKLMWIKDIESSAKTSAELLENLLKWALTQTDQLKFDPQKLDVNAIAEDARQLLSVYAKKKKIRLVNEIPYETFAKADEEMIKTVLRNLITNAIKFTNEKGKITISAGKQEKDVEITVADTGIGISKENLKKLFRIDNSFKSKGTKQETGTGLGLILCKEYVEKNGGTIRAESEKGKGSKFIFTLPAANG